MTDPEESGTGAGWVTTPPAIRWHGDTLTLLDQRQLPTREQYLQITTLDEAIEAFPDVTWEADPIKAALFDDIAARHDLKPGKAQAPVRVAALGRSVGPPLFESLELLGRDETVRRLRGEMTLLVISHQPAILETADRIYRLEDGRISRADDRSGLTRHGEALL